MLATSQFLHVGRQFEKLYNKIIRQVSDTHHLSKIEIDVLLFLYNNPGCDTARDIVELRGIAKSYVSKAVDLLLHKGFLSTSDDAADRRIVHLTIEDCAMPIVLDAKAAQKSILEILYQGISDVEQEQLRSIFTKMSKNIKEAL